MMYSQLITRRFGTCAVSNICKRYFSCISSYHVISNHQYQNVTAQRSSQIRTFWESFPFPRPSLHLKDGLNKEEYELVYRSHVFNYMFYGQLMSIIVFSTQIIWGSYYAYKSYITGEIVQTLSTVGPFTVTYDWVTLLVLIFFTCQNGLVFVAAQNMLLRVYHNAKKNKYVFVSLARNPFKSHRIFCKPGELQCLKNSRIPFIFGNHKLKDRQFFIKSSDFKSNYYYNEVIGYKYG